MGDLVAHPDASHVVKYEISLMSLKYVIAAFPTEYCNNHFYCIAFGDDDDVDDDDYDGDYGDDAQGPRR